MTDSLSIACFAGALLSKAGWRVGGKIRDPHVLGIRESEQVKSNQVMTVNPKLQEPNQKKEHHHHHLSWIERDNPDKTMSDKSDPVKGEKELPR